MAEPRVLVVQHEDNCPPAWLGEWLTDAGLVLDLRKPYAGDPLPGSLHDHGGLVVLGGAMGAYDDAGHPWLTPAKALLRQAVDSGVPALGVCLGHQLTGVALGGTVARHPAGRQVGLVPVAWTSEATGDPLFGGISAGARSIQWNNDVLVDLPPGARQVAGTPAGGPQVVRFGRAAWGVQFHPEAGPDVVGRWAQSYEREADAWDVDVRQVLKELDETAPELQRTWRAMADRFAELVRSG